MKILRNLLPYIAFILILTVFLSGLSRAGSSNLDMQEESLNKALRRNVTHSYAVDGYYPPSLDYIKEHYGLTYDSTEFLVDYKPIGSNIYPDINIIRLKEDNQ